MATSAGAEPGAVKRYMKSEKFKKRMTKVKKGAKGAEDPEAYTASVERKMVKGHFGKSEDLQNLLKTLNDEIEDLDEAKKKKVPSKHPGADLSAEKKSEIVKRAKKGEDIGKPGKKFKDIEAKAAERYGSEESGKRVAAAAMWKQAHKKGYK
jgi:hypothetical protein